MDQNDILAGFPVAAPWSLWTGSLGKGFIYAGIAFFLIATLCSAFGKRNERLARIGTLGMVLGCVSIFGAMACLITLFVKNQFQFEYVFGHSDIHSAVKYKVAAVWSGQQGSFLLWACTTSIFGLLSLRGTGEYRRWFVVTFSLFLASICGILAYETPYNIIADVMRDGKVMVPPSGRGLEASLLNYWVIIHPPTIFMGFGALMVPFAYSMSAMLTGNLKDWIAQVRPWVLVGLSLLGVGLVMGGLWAYETLGWGGFWKWDPVENTSFVPWILLAALVHGVIVQNNRKRWYGSNLWLGALPFLVFTYGTFLTRSGFLTDVSVHSFAEMNKSALVILEVLIGLSVAAFLVTYFVRGRPLARSMAAAAPTDGFSRETAYGFGNTLLLMLAFVIAIGMSWPFLLTKVFLQKAAVIEESLYHQVVVWFFIPIMLLMAVGPFVSWRVLPRNEFINRFINVFSLSAGLTGFAMLGINRTVPIAADAYAALPFGRLGLSRIPAPWLVAFLLFLCMFVAISSLWRIVENLRRTPTSIGGFAAHLGVATILAGLILSRGLESHDKGMVQAGDQITLLGYSLKPADFTGELRSPDNKLTFEVIEPGGSSFNAFPGLYYHPGKDGDDQAVLWPHVQHEITHDVYLTLHEPIITVWKDPVWLKEGETKTVDDITVKYLGMHMIGEPGQKGTSFGAKLQITVDGKTYAAEPHMIIGENSDIPTVNTQFRVAMTQMEAKDKSVAIQMYFSKPVYPVELYYKPFTGLIWLGTGILFLGGMLSAFVHRRKKPKATEAESEAKLAA